MHDLVILRDLAVILTAAVLVVSLLRHLGIPAIAGFILVGTLVGPRGLGLIGDVDQVTLMADIGVALLLFGIGLELSLDRFRRLWRVILIGGTLQVGITVVAVLLSAPLQGISFQQAFLLGIIVSLSSTAIILRGLQQQDELDAPHGRLAIGICFFQDLLLVPVMLAIPFLAGTTAAGSWFWMAAVISIGALLLILAAAHLVVPRLLHWVAGTRQRELFILTALLVCIGTAWLATLAGVSLALGAFLAGLIVAGSDYRHQAMAELVPFRDVLSSVFFISVGMLLDPRLAARDFGAIVALLAMILCGKFVIVMLTSWVMRLPLRTSVMAGITLAQVGEFSFVLYRAAEGTDLVALRFREPFLMAIILSMIVTPFLMRLAPRLAESAARVGLLRRMFRGTQIPGSSGAADARHDHIIIAGWGVAGQELGAALKAAGIPYVVADLNPQTVRTAAPAGEPIIYGDVTSLELLEHLGIHSARMMVLLVNDPAAAATAIRRARQATPTLPILVRTRYLAEIDALLQAGATDVVPAELEAAVEVAARVLSACGADTRVIADERARIRCRREDNECAPNGGEKA
ncbi:MAG: cation:proton antiporter [Candidatus Zixiibacteriota bacterium]